MMKTTRYSKSRQKACRQCTKAKLKCDRNIAGCSRCLQRGFPCEFIQAKVGDSVKKKGNCSDYIVSKSPDSKDETPHRYSIFEDANATSQFETDIDGSLYIADLPASMDTATMLPRLDNIDTEYAQTSRTVHNNMLPRTNGKTEDGLICPINAEEISNRWLNAYVPTMLQTVKTYPPNVASFIYNMLKSYAATIVRGRGVPPFIHTSQVSSLAQSPQLSACLSMARMCSKPVSGAEAVVAEILVREMNKIHVESSYREAKTLRTTFQAYLIHAMVLYFCLNRDSNLFLRQAMVSLQELACTSSRGGLVCLAERDGVRPRWETWIAAESQRRTLYLMYLFDNLLSISDGLPTFLGTELRGLPAPVSKALWHATSSQQWEAAYNLHLVDWPSGCLTIDDLWPAADGTDEAGLVARRERIDRWLEGVDEFGTMLYAVTCCTHGS